MNKLYFILFAESRLPYEFQAQIDGILERNNKVLSSRPLVCVAFANLCVCSLPQSTLAQHPAP
jgi:hypothetical protein